MESKPDKTVLIIGDSLTAGSPGASYVRRLERLLPDWRVISFGKAGDTLVGASRRALQTVPEINPQALIIEVGVNDLLLPYLSRRNWLWKAKVGLIERWGSPATDDPRRFQERYYRAVEGVKALGVPRVVVVTLSCLGEDLTTMLNRRRDRFNAILRCMPKEFDITLADVASEFDQRLQDAPRPGQYLLQYFWLGRWDKLVTRVEEWADVLSRKRGLTLTIDGVHFNRQGATVAANTLAKIFRGKPMKRYFTLEEANAVVEVVRPLIKEILEIRQKILDRQPELWPVLKKAAGNGGNKSASQVTREFDRLDRLVHAVHATGAQVKDINTGLLDFLALREGRDVYLCWKYGENDIQYWHDLEAGFAGRQPI